MNTLFNMYASVVPSMSSRACKAVLLLAVGMQGQRDHGEKFERHNQSLNGTRGLRRGHG